jgi:hypothetical protein
MKPKEKCFIIMPITTPSEFIDRYKGDVDHFKHVLDCLFLPAVEKAGFEAIPPKSTGSEIIQAEIIKHLSTSELVLCDMSILNPNVFFEFGIRTALNKPVALVGDDKVKIPFDTSIINFHKYSGALNPWEMDKEKEELSKHIKTAYEKGKNYNALWKYFGVAQTGVFKPEEASIGEKIDLLISEVTALKNISTNPFKGNTLYTSYIPTIASTDETDLQKWLREALGEDSAKKKSMSQETFRGYLSDYLRSIKQENKTPEKDSPKQ